MIMWWFVALLIILLYWKFSLNKKVPFETKYVYERLPVVYDECNGLTARHVYLVRMAYGNRNKRFFFPSATISLRFYDGQNKNVAAVQLKPQLLTENHRRYLRLSNSSSSDTFLYVLYKRKTAMNGAELMLINHNIHGGTIMVYNLFMLRLADNSVFGSKICKSIQCLEAGLDPDSQSFRYVCFGKCVDYVGPRRNVSLFEIVCFIYLNISLIMICCTSVLSCEKNNFCCMVCRHFKSLSHAFEISLYTSLGTVAFTTVLLLIFQCVFKRLNAKWNNVGYIWLVMKGLPYFMCIICIILDVTTIVLLKTGYEASQIVQRQHFLWFISTLFAWTIYILTMFLLIIVLYLNGYFDELVMPQLEFESDKMELISKDERKHQEPNLPITSLEQKSSNYSTRNLVISSTLQERSTLDKADSKAASISKIIDANYSNKKKPSKGKIRNSSSKTTNNNSTRNSSKSSRKE